ncbi:3'(2'),5'-bisphosphate nucleotidase CysQ [Streptomyces djakartensis]|uniref:3'(2'),5'-bisphosphate nucleotidase CysQ n=1 Tax=Streptomyces djakartensis TaxID=68193 RepID=A0ABQ2ZC22_9ACTN|nr:3'(2'),5'-bisphosphate nucleotidase CysQ [Streptomyces djakartensis]GGY07924.1 3'(2'),5'-bisphosphate nucleotidase CysQ [Streptomyces djakartensis]
MSSTDTHDTGEAHQDDHAFARACAEEAGARLMEIRAAAAPDTDPRELKAAGDRGAQSVLADLLKRHRPYDAVLSEEAADDRGRLSARRVWIIDPLDGTREFAEPHREDWAVHVALWEEGRLRAGAVALPARGTVLCTDDPVPPRAAVRRRPRMLVSRTRPPEFVTRLAEELGADLVPQGSAGAKTASVVLGEADLYVHAGGQYEWDSAAPAAVAAHYGCTVLRLDGSVPRYNRADPMLPDLAVCAPELHEPFRAAFARVCPDWPVAEEGAGV